MDGVFGSDTANYCLAATIKLIHYQIFGKPLVGVGNVVKGLDHFGPEFGLDGGKRERVLHIVVVEIAFGRSVRLPLAVTFPIRSRRRRLERGRALWRGLRQ